MNIFDKIIHTTLREEVTHLNKDDLDPTVFQFSAEGIPTLREGIRIQILKDIDEIRKVLPVVNFFIIGEILTKHYETKTAIDVSVQVDAEAVDNISTADVLYLLKFLNGHFASDTMHKINYYIITYDLDETVIDAMYDIMNDRWRKSPKVYDPEVEKWLIKVNNTLKSIDISTGRLTRDLIEPEELHDLDSKYINRFKILLKQKLSTTEEVLKQMCSTFRNSNVLQQAHVERLAIPQEIQEFGKVHKLPENIILKLLEKFYLIKLIKRVEDMLDERDELTLTDTPELKRAIGGVWKTS